VRKPGKTYQKLSEIGLAPGMKLFWSEINYTKETGFGKFSLAAYWKRKYRGKASAEGWYILTNLSQIEEVIKVYQARFGIEALFKDCKTGGYNLEGSKASIERLTRLVLLIAIAYTCACLTGDKTRRSGQQKYVCRLKELKRTQRRHSNFWIGLYGQMWIFLQGHGVSTTYAVKIFKQYGEKAIAIVTANPYQLAADIYGIGFVTADTLARSLGIEPGSEFRYRAGIVHVLGEAAEEGHCFLPQSELVDQSVKRLATDDHQPQANAIASLIQKMETLEELVLQGEADQQHCYQPAFFQTEQNLAQQLRQLLVRPITVDLPRVRRWLERFRAKTAIELSEQQQLAVEMAASLRVLVLTGGPGCGKTFTTRTIVALWKAMGKSIALAAPTGRAAQRLSEMTGQPASTLHRLLEFEPKTMGFKHDAANPLNADAIVVDEASMLDLFLAYSLIKAVPPEAQLLLVGDIDQLPSVGPGNVLRDLIASKCVPVVRLTQVFRQAQSSQIVLNAHQINQGKFPHLESVSLTPRSDCLWLGAPEPEYGVQGIQELLTDLIPQLGFNPIQDVQVLCPLTRGVVGTRNLNQVLQNLLNPARSDKAEVVRGGITLRVGDRLIQRVNDYEREVFNGDLGVIVAIDSEEQEVRVQFDQRQVTYDYADLNEVDLAWAVTIHKSQGSEYPVVMLPLFPQHYLMLSRNLLYTGLTRAKKLAVIVGPKKAVAMAVNQVKDQMRYTGLARRLSGAM
jgi:exodeoxyribonuclease V alpha subunit